MNSNLEKLILGAKRGDNKALPVLELINKRPDEAAIISKLKTDQSQPHRFNNQGNKQVSAPDPYLLKSISENTALSSNDSENILKLLPDMDLTVQVLVSSIISPSDMMKNEILYLPPKDIVNSNLASTLIEVVKEYFKNTYDLNAKLPEILREIVAISGSYPICVLPENSIDDLINNRSRITIESLGGYTEQGFFKPMGFLALKERSVKTDAHNRTGIALESLRLGHTELKVSTEDITLDLDVFSDTSKNSLLTITDNFNVLKVPLLNERIREQYVQTALEAAGARSITDQELVANIYRSNQGDYRELEVIKNSNELKRKSIGNPLIMKLPPESVIPIHVPGNPEKHIGYYILIDELGYPISKLSSPGYREQLRNKTSTGNSTYSNAMTSKVNSYMETGEYDRTSSITNRQQGTYEFRAYTEIVEAQLLAKLKNGIGSGGAELANNEEVYRIMLARSLAGQHTQILFIPVEFMSYFALKYTDKGIGQSITDFNRTLLSMRVMLMFGNLMCSINNSIARRVATIHYDEKDPDPEKTLEIIMGELVRGRQNALPLTLNTPADIVDWLNKASIEFAFDGHPKFPDLKVDISEKNSNLAKPDIDLENELKKRSQMGFGVPPDNVDSSWGPEFARSITNQNILTAKRVLQIQQQFAPQLTEFMRKIALHSEELMSKLTKLINENINHVQLNEDTLSKLDDKFKPYICRRVADDFVKGLTTKLPEPITTTNESSFDSVDNFDKLLEAAMNAHFPEEGLKNEILGDAANNIGTWKANLKAYFMRNWMSQNAILPEMGAMITGAGGDESENAKNIWDEMTDYASCLGAFIVKAQNNTAKFKKAANAVIAQIEPGEQSTGNDGSSSEDYGAASGDDNTSPNIGGEDDLIPDETPATGEETPEESPEENTNAGKEDTEKQNTEEKPNDNSNSEK